MQNNVKTTDNTLDFYMNIYYNIKKNTAKEGMEMYRKVMEYLKSWKDSKYRKPLILQGARQVGKTYTLLEFGRTCYENVACFNFETDPKPSTTFSEFENAIEWLCLSGIVSQVYKAEQIKKPLENYRDIDAFKIYVSDTGLLCAKKDLSADDILYMSEELDDFKGGMAENYVNVQLLINGYTTYYWESERGAEVDFVIQREGKLIPVEVKSADNTKAKSLKVYIDTYKPEYAIKLSSRNFGFEDGKKTVPLYAAFCI